jgi:hypothetical protein
VARKLQNLEARAILAARQALKLETEAEARVYRVHHLDRNGDYLFIEFGPAAGVVAVATVDVIGEVMGFTRLPGVGPHLGVTRARALEIAGATEAKASQAQLVWRPCRASQSPMYPFWAVKVGGVIVYVDQSGRVWLQLETGTQGG